MIAKSKCRHSIVPPPPNKPLKRTIRDYEFLGLASKNHFFGHLFSSTGNPFDYNYQNTKVGHKILYSLQSTKFGISILFCSDSKNYQRKTIAVNAAFCSQYSFKRFSRRTPSELSA